MTTKEAILMATDETGFRFGAAVVTKERGYETGAVKLRLKTFSPGKYQRHSLEVFVTKTGVLRIRNSDTRHEWSDPDNDTPKLDKTVTVFGTDAEVAEAYVRQNQKFGRNGTNSFSFQGNILFSYGTIIAMFVKTRGGTVLLHDNTNYSKTTAVQQYWLIKMAAKKPRNTTNNIAKAIKTCLFQNLKLLFIFM